MIWLLLKYLRSHDFLVFLIYRVAVAALVLGMIATGVRPRRRVGGLTLLEPGTLGQRDCQ